MSHPYFAADKTKIEELTQAVNGGIAVLSRGDLAGRLAATLNKWLKRPGLEPVCFRDRFFCF
jgi:hypothetical protein